MIVKGQLLILYRLVSMKAPLRPPMKAMELYDLVSWVSMSVILTVMTFKFWNELQYGLLTLQRFVASLQP